ncbi:unnamed protein product [Onchocerca flexuosa]|uniref:Uncharacterized protein n=1 Tax=Onchocerca flexuosa TaxID=387005 RepID=A0A183HUM9_9BILA|nr:unnamed protein product [Onchocerca flexuosa]
MTCLDYDLPLRAYPLLLGLTYKNNNFHWSDNSSFNYDGFLDVAYEEKLSIPKSVESVPEVKDARLEGFDVCPFSKLTFHFN